MFLSNLCEMIKTFNRSLRETHNSTVRCNYESLSFISDIVDKVSKKGIGIQHNLKLNQALITITAFCISLPIV